MNIVKILPESTGWMLFINMEKASKGDKSPTAAATSGSVVNT